MNLRKNNVFHILSLILLQFGGLSVYAQDCSSFTATYTVTESRCTATGTLQINVSGGSGSYNYKIQSVSGTDFTSSSLITGLKPGTYSVTITDIVGKCTFQIDNIIITGSYSDPRFGLTETDVTCMNGSDGTISVAGLTNGRTPFNYSIVAPSASGIGTTNSTGIFTGLTSGSYSIQLTDSCGGIQTRNISIQNYNWNLSGLTVSQNSCTSFHASISLTDSKGHTNASGSFFNGFTYGIVNNSGDTSWFATAAFDFDLMQKRSAVFVVKDNCGSIQSKIWNNTAVPSVQANLSITGYTCTGFNASVMGQQNLTNPVYCLTDISNNPVSGQPCNSTGIFTNIPYGSYCINITNNCYDTIIKRCFTQNQLIPTISGVVALSNYTCTDFTATVTGQQNLTSPQYCLLDASNNPVAGFPCNSTGTFFNIPFGTYTIRVTDGCTGAILNASFSASEKIKSVAANITTSGYTCSSFNAGITGQTNLINPQYCLVDNVGNPVSGQPCNTNGIFNNLPYGSYCIRVTDACADTTIERCMTIVPPVANGGSASISNKNCNGFTISITGQNNIFNGLFCLQDSLGNPISGFACNNTGVFTDVPYGSYCVKTTDACSGTVLTNCFNVTAPALAVGPVLISNINCTGFTAVVSGLQNLTNPVFCLFDSANNPVGICNNTGTFVITGFGPYSIQTTDGCAGTQFISNFSLNKPIPSVASGVNISNQSCTDFTATITGQANLFNPHYFLKDNLGNPVSDNTSGIFSSLPYGSYCIDIVSGCLDTTIVRCFTSLPEATQMNLLAKPSCIFNATDISVQVTAGFAPYTASVYNAADSLLLSITSNSNQFNLNGLPALSAGSQYKIVVNGNCGTPAIQLITGQPSSISHIYTITPKCPSSITPSGSGDLLITATSTLGTLDLRIVARNGVADTIGYSFHSGNDFTFNNLDAATYVLAYSFTGCSMIINDTISLPEYTFPSLAPSGAYQCDNNNFSVGASVVGGMAPYNYQIIGSQPAAPSINSALQTNPVFTISNGIQYNLVRLRAIDACGNATLNDVSILPLANTIINASANCIYKASTLSVENVANATYSWYRKANMESTDSTLIGTDPTYSIPAVSVADTGIYINHMVVNSGCLTKISYFHLDGMCGGLFTLPPSVQLQGKMLTASSNLLSWTAPANNYTAQYMVERRVGNNGSFIEVGTVTANNSESSVDYSFTDKSIGDETYFYRLKIMSNQGTFIYSNIAVISSGKEKELSVYPNPIRNIYYISMFGSADHSYQLTLFDLAGRLLFTRIEQSKNDVITMNRNPIIKTGIYLLKINDIKTGTIKIVKLFFE